MSDGLLYFIKNWQIHLNDYKKILVNEIKCVFKINDTSSIKMGVIDYFKKINEVGKPVLYSKDHEIFDALNCLSYNDLTAIDEISKAVLGAYIEDWSNDRFQDLRTSLQLFINNLEKSDKINTQETSFDGILEHVKNVEETPMGILLRNGVESVFEEYGEAVSNNEKIAILADIIEKLF